MSDCQKCQEEVQWSVEYLFKKKSAFKRCQGKLLKCQPAVEFGRGAGGGAVAAGAVEPLLVR